MSIIIETLGQKLSRMRKESGKTQKQMATKIKVDIKTWRHYEQDVYSISTPDMIKVCIYCQWDMITMLSDFMPKNLLPEKVMEKLKLDRTGRIVKK